MHAHASNMVQEALVMLDTQSRRHVCGILLVVEVMTACLPTGPADGIGLARFIGRHKGACDTNTCCLLLCKHAPQAQAEQPGECQVEREVKEVVTDAQLNPQGIGMQRYLLVALAHAEKQPQPQDPLPSSTKVPSVAPI